MRESSEVDLRSWIVAEHAAGLDRFDHAIVAHVSQDRWKERAGEGGASIAWLLFHLSWHEDLAVKTAVQGEAPVLIAWRDRSGLDGTASRPGSARPSSPT